VGEAVSEGCWPVDQPPLERVVRDSDKTSDKSPGEHWENTGSLVTKSHHVSQATGYRPQATPTDPMSSL